ncbi:MAG: hypothetical protein H0T46_07120, partial [Deltaproteobacteria bacterium]|nr:hypothetical protein [Deltaproteobacteria bacterium]
MKRRPGGAGLTRRDWVRFISTLPAASTLIACGDNLEPLRDGGVAILEPWSQGFLVAIWASRGDHAIVVVRSGGEVIERIDVELDDGLGSVDISGLPPDRSFEVTTLTSVGPLGPNHVRTAPADDHARRVRIAVSADFDPSPAFDSDLVDHLLGAEPELFVSLGDFPYTDNGPVAKTVGEYRQRHFDLRTAPAARALFEGLGVRAIYDDHEFRNDWD